MTFKKISAADLQRRKRVFFLARYVFALHFWLTCAATSASSLVTISASGRQRGAGRRLRRVRSGSGARPSAAVKANHSRLGFPPHSKAACFFSRSRLKFSALFFLLLTLTRFPITPLILHTPRRRRRDCLRNFRHRYPQARSNEVILAIKMAFSISQAVLTHRESLTTFPIPGHPDLAMTFKNYRVTGNMISG